MSVGLYNVPTTNNLQYTLNSSYSVGGTTLTLNATLTGVVQYPGTCVVDRIDSSGNKTATKRTYYKFTGVSGQQLTGVSTVDGTDQSHSVGAIVEFVPDITQQQAIVDTFAVEHDKTTGKHTNVTASGASLGTVAIQDLKIVNSVNMSGASIVGVAGGAGGFSGLFYVPYALASLANVAGLIPIPTNYTAQYMQAFVQTPSSLASVSMLIMKNNVAWANIAIPAGATFASSASFSDLPLVAGDELRLNINSTASSAAYLSVLVRAT